MKRISRKARFILMLLYQLLYWDNLFAKEIASNEITSSSRVNSDSENTRFCNSLDSCLSDLATPFEGNYPKTETIVINLQKIGRPAVKPILQLLQSKHPSVQYRASYVLSKMQQNLLPEDLPYLKQLMLSGGGRGWLALAIGNIGTPEAIRILVDDKIRHAFELTDTDQVLAKYSSDAIPFLLEKFSCEPKCLDWELSTAIGGVLSDLKEKSADAVKPLADIAADESQPRELRLAALNSLRFIDSYAKEKSDDLELIRHLAQGSDKVLAEFSVEILAAICDPAAISGLIAKLQTEANAEKTNRIYQLSRMGKNALQAGPALEKLVSHYTFDVSAKAAQALGQIGYQESTPTLLMATFSQDWELVFQAIWSLGQLRAVNAYDRLTELQHKHWSYPVRKIAEQALETLNEPFPDFDPIEIRKTKGDYVWPDLSRWISEAPRCEFKVQWKNQSLNLQDQKIWPQSKLPITIPSFIPNDAYVVFAVNDGWLVGFNRGEFCGSSQYKEFDCGLYFFDATGHYTPITVGSYQVDGIYQTSNGLVFTEGVDHLMYWPGQVFKIIRSGKSAWKIQPLSVLQASPRKTAVAEDGTLIIQTAGSVVAINKGGKLEAVACHD